MAALGVEPIAVTRWDSRSHQAPVCLSRVTLLRYGWDNVAGGVAGCDDDDEENDAD